MEIIPYAALTGLSQLSSAGRGRMMLIEAEIADKIFDIPSDIRAGDGFGYLGQDSSYYRVKKISPITTLNNVNLSKMNRSCYFMIVIKTKNNVLKLVEFTLIQ